MQQMQTTMALAAMSGSMGGNPMGGIMGGGDDQGGIMGQLGCAPQPTPPKEDEEIDEEIASIPEDQVAKYTLRMCIHSGQGFSREKSYVQVTIQQAEAHGGPIVLESPWASESESPSWEWSFEKEITIEGSPPDCEIQIWGSRILRDVMIGAAKFPIPQTPTDGPKRKELKFNVEQNKLSEIIGAEKPEAPKALIVWELVEDLSGEQPDLARIAEMPPTATVKKNYKFKICVNNVQLKKPGKPTDLYKGLVELIDKKGRSKAREEIPQTEVVARPATSKKAKKKQQRAEEKAAGGQKKTEKLDYLNWGETLHEGWEAGGPSKSGKRREDWSVMESKVGLLNYYLKVKLLKGHRVETAKDKKKKEREANAEKTENQGSAAGVGDMSGGGSPRDSPRGSNTADAKQGPIKWTCVGVWEDKVGDLLDAMAESDSMLFFDAEMTEPGLRPQPMGKMNLLLDVFTGVPHKRNTNFALAMSSAGEVKADLRKGWSAFRGQAGRAEITYHVSCWADGLPALGDKADPYVVIKMGHPNSKKGETERRTNQYNNVYFKTAAKVKTIHSDRKATIQFWDNNTWFTGDRLIGEANIYDVEADKLFWRHAYGGAFKALLPDVADQMVRGGLTPTTYAGTVAVLFSTRPRSMADFEKKIKEARHKKRLAVRLYRGLYLPKRYHGKSVSVVIQLAGANLPDTTTDQMLKEAAKKTGTEREKKEKDIFSSTGKFNRSILAFPGHVDDRGILTFQDKQTENLADMMAKTFAKPADTLAWIQKSTPKDYPLYIPVNADGSLTVTHCYVYIVEESCEDAPPELYTRFRIDSEPEVFQAYEWKEEGLLAINSSNWESVSGKKLTLADLKGTSKYGEPRPASETDKSGNRLPDGAKTQGDIVMAEDVIMMQQTDIRYKKIGSDGKPKVKETNLWEYVMGQAGVEAKDLIVEMKTAQDKDDLLADEIEEIEEDLKEKAKTSDKWKTLSADKKANLERLTSLKANYLKQRQKTAEKALNTPRWKRLRSDPSVSESNPDIVFNNDFGGFLLGSAYVINYGRQAELEAKSRQYEDLKTDEDKKKKEGDEKTQAPVARGTLPPSPVIDHPEGKEDEIVLGRKRIKDPLLAKKIFPKGSMPESIMCRPCLGETIVHRASTGDPDEFFVGLMAKDVDDKTDLSNYVAKYELVYCLVDVVCCRSLKATDDDGLCDPCYKIKVEDRVLCSWENDDIQVPKSLNPSFMHRIMIPVRVPLPVIDGKVQKVKYDVVKVDGTMAQQETDRIIISPFTCTDSGCSLPLPPVILKLKDQDSKLEDLGAIAGAAQLLPGMSAIDSMMGMKFNPISTVCVKHPTNLDYENKDEYDKRNATDDFMRMYDKSAAKYKKEEEERRHTPRHVNLNLQHRPFWHALDAPAKIAWNGYQAGNDPAWVDRPRALLAVGYTTRVLEDRGFSADSDDSKHDHNIIEGSASIPGRMDRSARKPLWIDSCKMLYHERLPNKLAETNLRGTKQLERYKEEHVLMGKIRTENSLYLKILVDLLGLRNVPSSMFMPEVKLTSYWNGPPVRLNLEVPDVPSRMCSCNFGILDKPMLDKGRYTDFAEKVKSIVRLTCEDEQGDGEDSDSGSEDGKSEESLATTVDVDQLLGVRIGLLPPDELEGKQAKDKREGQRKLSKKGRPTMAAGKPATPIFYQARIIDYLQPKAIPLVPNDKQGKCFTCAWRPDWRERLDDEFKRMGLDTKAKRRYLLECKDKNNRSRCIFSPFINEVISQKEFPLTFTMRNLDTGEDSMRNKVIIMPDLVTQLASRTTGTDYGTLSFPLPAPPKPEELEVSGETWTEVCSKEYQQLIDGDDNWLAGVVPLKSGVQIDELAYQCFIDVFAYEKGYLKWDNDFRIGRALSNQKLFTIMRERKSDVIELSDSDSDADKDDPDRQAFIDRAIETATEGGYPFNQYFNPVDWMLGKSYFTDEPFDQRVRPVLRCANWVNDGNDASWKSTRENVVPKSKGELYKEFFEHQKTAEYAANEKLKASSMTAAEKRKRKKPPVSIKHEIQLANLSTQNIFKKTQEDHFRCVSHLHVPEYVRDIDDPQHFQLGHEAGSEEFEEAQPQPGLDQNLHTFMRKLGHVITAEDRDSRFLCKLWMGLSEESLNLEEANKASNKLRSQNSVTSSTVSSSFASLSDAEDDAYDKLQLQDHMLNFLVIRFDLPGTVIWAAPEDKFEWKTPGRAIFAVKLADSDTIVPVCVPNFDLRFQQETAWYPCKTMYERWQTLRNRISKSNTASKEKADKTGGTGAAAAAAEGEEETDVEKGEGEAEEVEADVEGEAAQAEGQEDGDATKAFKIKSKPKKVKGKDEEPEPKGGEVYTGPDGYSQALFVHKHAFVCRLRKKQGGHNFDREQTTNWYRTVLEDSFPEIRRLAPLKDEVADRENIKDIFMRRFLNFRETMSKGEHGQEAGMIKGNIQVMHATGDEILEAQKQHGEFKSKEKKQKKEHKEAEPKSWSETISGFMKQNSMMALAKQATDAVGLGSTIEPPKLYRPVENLWNPAQVEVHVYVLTANDIKLPSGMSTFTPKVHAGIIGHSVKESEVYDDLDSKKAQAITNFYKVFPLHAQIPGDDTLKVSVFHHNRLLSTETEIGSAEIDIEDRWLTLMRRGMRCTTNLEYLKQNVCCDTTFSVKGGSMPIKEEKAEERLRREEVQAKSALDILKKGKKPKHSAKAPKLEGEPRKKIWVDPIAVLDANKANANKADPDNMDIPDGQKISTQWRSPEFEKKENKKTGGTKMLVDTHHENNKKWSNKHSGYIKISPKISPAERLPVEILDMAKIDEDTASEEKTGVMRLWVDMSLETDNYKQASLAVVKTTFIIKVVIKNCRNISVYKDVGERNDAQVTAKLKIKNFTGKERIEHRETDVHKWATTSAAWNWQWLFEVAAPVSFCSLNLCLQDADTLSSDDPIYDPKDYPLEHLLMLAWTAKRDAQPTLGTLKEKMIFDSWPGKGSEDGPGCCTKCCCKCCCPQNYKKPEHMHARLYFDITVTPKEDDDGKDIDNAALSEPRGRMDWKTAISDPVRFANTMLGPTILFRCKQGGICFACVVIIVVILAAFFFSAQGSASLKALTR